MFYLTSFKGQDVPCSRTQPKDALHNSTGQWHLLMHNSPKYPRSQGVKHWTPYKPRGHTVKYNIQFT